MAESTSGTQLKFSKECEQPVVNMGATLAHKREELATENQIRMRFSG